MKHLLQQLAAGAPLTAAQAVAAFDAIMTGRATPAQIGALLGLMQARGPTVDEITAAAQVMRQKVTPVAVPSGLTVIDTCGTGGDHAGTFNVSTAAALVAAAAGRPHGVAVAKHGNRSVTSQSGSSQVLEALGVKLPVGGDTLTRCLDAAGICFCFAPSHHPAMKYAAPVRAELGFRTIFNLLGPLTNPAGATRQVVGVFSAALTEPIAQVLANLGSEHAWVVHGQSAGGASAGGPGDRGIDELSTLGPSRVSETRGLGVRTFAVDPDALGVARGDLAALQVAGPAASAAMIRAVLAGESGPPRDIVSLNAAAALVVAGLADDLEQGVAQAADAIDAGAAARTLDRLIALTNA